MKPFKSMIQFHGFIISLAILVISTTQVNAGGGNPPPIRDGVSGVCNGSGIHGPTNVYYDSCLSGFYFNFEGGGVDHHLKGTSALIYRNDRDFEFTYEDKSGDDDFYYILSWQEVPSGTTFHSFSGSSRVGGLNHLLGTVEELPGVPVLVGFKYKFTNGDHHLKKIKARVYINTCLQAVYGEVAFEDKNADDNYEYTIYYAMIPCCNVVDMGSVSGHAKGDVTRSIPAPYPALQGFELKYTSGDHHMDRLGVITYHNEVSVYFRDKNADDEFYYQVWWVDVD